MNKAVYTGFSSSSFFTSKCLWIAVIVGLVFMLPHFNENRPVISVITILGLLFLFFVGDDRIIIYSDRIVQTTNSLHYLLSNSNDRVYKIEDIKKAYLCPEGNEPDLGFGVGLLLAFTLPKNSWRSPNESRPIYLDLKNGESTQIETALGWEKMQKIVDVINSLVKN